MAFAFLRFAPVALMAASDPFYTHFHAQPIKVCILKLNIILIHPCSNIHELCLTVCIHPSQNWLNDPNGPMFFNGTLCTWCLHTTAVFGCVYPLFI